MGYKSVEIENAWKIKLFLGNMQVFRDEEKINIPLQDIDVLIINNPQILISQMLLIELANKNILTILCDNKRLSCCNLYPISGHYNSLKIIQAQYNWDKNFKFNNWEKIIRMKIISQINLLKFYKIHYDSNLENNLSEIAFGDETNREAIVAKQYFQYLFGENFNRRSETDEFQMIVNSFLNYGYSILLSIVSRSVVKNGLDNRIALFHKSFDNHFALACDLMEPFRCIVDSKVFKLIENLKNNVVMLDTEAKRSLVTLMTENVMFANEKMSISLAIDKFVHSLIENKLVTNIIFLYERY